ncbi:methyl-accepting chemotaxis protein [Rahnella sp. PAMC25617]|mgnify:FL=1|uniref:methyl-accepting chemotaxis protein n=1 Tax=Rahnella sp. PAMC25617 TaxID=3399684 RepID=UPI003D36296F
MFKGLKISTGITGIIATLALFIVVIAGLSLMNAMSAKSNFARMATSVDNTTEMQHAVFNLNGGLAHVNALMLETSLHRQVNPEAVTTVQGIFAQAETNIKAFMATPFNSEEEKQAAGDLSKQFEKVLSLSRDKLRYIADPAQLPDALDQEWNERMSLRDKIDTYAAISARQNQGYIDQADRDYHNMIIMAVIVLLISVAVTVTNRIWVRHALVLRMEQTSRSIRMISSGDLRQKIETGNPNELGLMLAELESMRLSLTETVSGVQQGVKQIYLNAQEIAQGNNNLSARTEEQASALQETAASMEELKTTVRHNADNAHTARQLAEGASSNAHKGGNVVSDLDGIMQEITKSSRQIADINHVIDSIASQTNILALNAAVEAARAGEQGRGFAVVASEVRNLAKRSADAAKEISQLITTCVNNMSTGSQQVEQAGRVMKEIVNSVTQVTDIMGEIASASDEQSAGINQIAQAVNEMDHVTQQNASMVEEAALASSNLEAQTESLEKIVGKFSLNEKDVTADGEQKIKTASYTASTTGNKVIPKIIPALQGEEWETF